MLGLMQYPQRLGLFSRNSQICGSSATYRSTVPLLISSNQMFYATQSILQPLSRTPSLGAVLSTRPNTYITKPNYDSDVYSSSRAKGKVTVNFKKISRQSPREDVSMLFFARNMRDLDHTLLGQIPKKVVPHLNVLTPSRAKRIVSSNRTLVVLKYLNFTRLHTRPQELKHSVHKQSLLHTITHRKILCFRSRL